MTHWRRNRPIQERVFTDWVLDGTCWRWTGTINNGGYGTTGGLLAHRVAYEQRVGPIPAGLVIDHVKERGCRFRDCINPDHLEAVTFQENIRRGMRRESCPAGHPLTPENTSLAEGTRRCLTCRREQARKRRAEANLASDDPRHGTTNGYSNYQCRCEACREAAALHWIASAPTRERRRARLAAAADAVQMVA